MKRLVLAACCAALAGSAASAQEIVRAGPEGAPPAAEATPTAPAVDPEAAKARAIGDWAQRVLAGAPAAEDEAPANGAKPAAAKGCNALPASDGKPHGEVWAGVGNHGYREVGGVVTQPLGRCGSLTVAVDRTEGNFGRRGRR
ncbi:MAG: hypothetical protein JF588_18985 [Caulobacterales bacterium]|nr:hypothetical protein [Caulobacterales bacterium]